MVHMGMTSFVECMLAPLHRQSKRAMEAAVNLAKPDAMQPRVHRIL